MAKEEKKSKTIDDLFGDVRRRKHGKLEDSFKAYDDVTHEDKLNEMLINIFQPAMDDFYSTFTNELDKIGLKNEASIDNAKKKDVQAAAVEALKAFFKKTRPGVLDALKDVKDVEEQYRILTRQYNLHHGLSDQSQSPEAMAIDKVIEHYIGNPDAKVAELKSELYQRKAHHARRAIGFLRNQAYHHFLGTYHAPEVAAHVRGMAKKKGYEVTDAARFLGQEHDALMGVYEAVKKEAYGDLGPKQYHLKKAEKKEK